ncbi:hypothetical protein Q6247_25315, partial [Klebsiella pneumoniae]
LGASELGALGQATNPIGDEATASVSKVLEPSADGVANALKTPEVTANASLSMAPRVPEKKKPGLNTGIRCEWILELKSSPCHIKSSKVRRLIRRTKYINYKTNTRMKANSRDEFIKPN